jgi:hypothetical protein
MCSSTLWSTDSCSYKPQHDKNVQRNSSEKRLELSVDTTRSPDTTRPQNYKPGREKKSCKCIVQNNWKDIQRDIRWETSVLGSQVLKDVPPDWQKLKKQEEGTEMTGFVLPVRKVTVVKTEVGGYSVALPQLVTWKLPGKLFKIIHRLHV